MEPKNKKINLSISQYIALVLVSIALIVGIVFAVDSLQSDTSNQETAQETTNDSKVVEAETKDHISYEATTDGSALDQLQATNDSVVVIESELGKYVDSINDLAGGTDGKYWSFYVDGELADVGADAYELKGGELIEWKFQKL